MTGRRLNVCIRRYAHDRSAHRETDAIQDAAAVRQFGSNAIPFLLKWIEYEEPLWRKRFEHRIFPSLPPGLRRFAPESPEIKADVAIEGFRILGPLATNAVPQLTDLMNGSRLDVRQRAMEALIGIGKEGVLVMAKALGDPNTPDWEAVAVQMSVALEGDADFTLAIPSLLKYRKSLNGTIAERASRIIRRLGNEEPDGFAKRLATSLCDTNSDVRLSALEVLADMGHNARQAEHSVAAAESDPDPNVRNAATNALEAIQSGLSKE